MQGEPISQEQNALAYKLNEKLINATEKFRRDHPKMSINAIFGAANVYVAGWLSNAPNKAAALEMLEANHAILQNLINSTPDYMFGHNKSNLN